MEMHHNRADFANPWDIMSINIKGLDEDNLPSGDMVEATPTPAPIPADGNSGNIEAEDNLPDGDQTDVMATPAPVEADGNSGNIEAEDNMVSLNLQDLTLQDCQEAGFGA